MYGTSAAHGRESGDGKTRRASAVPWIFQEPEKRGVVNSVIYELIIFDWDGTAVPDRHAPIGALKAALEQLLREGALLRNRDRDESGQHPQAGHR